MNSWEKERAEQEAADQAEEERVARKDERWKAETARLRKAVDDGICHQFDYRIPPYLFADERSQRHVEEEASFYGPLDDCAAFQDKVVGAERLFR